MKTLYIITGANRGLGKAFYDILVSDKFENIIVSVSRQINEDQVSELNKPNAHFHYCHIDFSTFKNPASLKMGRFRKMVDRIVYINNAGTIEPIGRLGNLDNKESYRAMQVNVVAPALLLNYLIQCFQGKALDLINISSGAADKSIEGWSIYCSSKSFTKMLFQTIAKENNENDKIRVFQFDPGVIDTAMQEKIRQTKSFSWQKDFIELKISGKLQSAEQVAKKILNEIGAL